jgi:hypothetical protein
MRSSASACECKQINKKSKIRRLCPFTLALFLFIPWRVLLKFCKHLFAFCQENPYFLQKRSFIGVFKPEKDAKASEKAKRKR